MGGVRGGGAPLFVFDWEEGWWGWGRRLFETGPLLIFSAFSHGRLFEEGANSKLGAYLNKYSPGEAHRPR